MSALPTPLPEPQAETAALAGQLARFEIEYTAAVTPYYARLDRWRLRCDEQNWVVARLQARLAQRAQPEPTAPPLRPEEVYADLAGEFRARRAQMDEEAQTPPPAPPPEPTLSSADEDELRQLYRQLAKERQLNNLPISWSAIQDFQYRVSSHFL